MAKRVHYIDLETHTFGPARMCPPIVCMAWRSEGDGLPDDEARLALWEAAIPVMGSMLDEAIAGDAVIVAHKAAYDFACIVANCRRLAPKVWAAYAADGIECTRAREKLIDIRNGTFIKGRKGYYPYSLDEICARTFDRRLDKGADGWRLRYAELDGIPVPDWPRRAVGYAKDDVVWLRRVYLSQASRMVASHYDCPTQHMDARASFALELTGAWGVTTDRPRALNLRSEISERMIEIEDVLIDAGLMRRKEETLPLFAGIRSPTVKDMRAIRAAVESTWPEALGPVPRTDGTKAISTSKDTMDLCAHPALERLVEYNALEKTASTYVEALVQKIIHCSYNELVSSGRTSCRAINIQNQPRLPGIRECFIARPGYGLVACDFDSQEMRTLAEQQLAIVGHSKLAENYQRSPGFDPHQTFADAMNAKRQDTKIANFGIPGGMGVKGLIRFAKSWGASWSPAYAAEIRKKYFQWYPEMEQFFAFVQAVVGPHSCGNLTIPQSGMVLGAVGYCDASNRTFQTLAAHASKCALFEVVRRCFDPTMRSVLLASRPWAFIHDEVIVESPEYAVHEVAEEMERVMAGAMQPWTPHIPAMASATPQRRWSKQAKRITGPDGRLALWDESLQEAA